jgi:hypothetical protein
MNTKELWKKFTETGKIEDYLRYSRSKKNDK